MLNWGGGGIIHYFCAEVEILCQTLGLNIKDVERRGLLTGIPVNFAESGDFTTVSYADVEAASYTSIPSDLNGGHLVVVACLSTILAPRFSLHSSQPSS